MSEVDIDQRETLRERYGVGEESIAGRIKENWTGYLFIFPPLLMFTFLFYIPLLRGFWMTFQQVMFGAPDQFVGLENYLWLLTNDLFQYSLIWTIVFVVATTTGQLIVGLAAALLINEVLRGKQLISALIMSPYFSAPIAGGAIMFWFLSPDFGLVARLFREFGLQPIQFFTAGILPNVTLIIAQIWHDFGYAGVIYLAGLSTIPKSQYEAAALDGASMFQRFRLVTVPYLVTPTVIILATRTTWNLSEFAQPFELTAGGPGNQTMLLSILLYDQAFQKFNYGRAFVVGLTMLVLAVLAAIVYIRVIQAEQELYA